MTFNTKFSIGDVVFFLDGYHIQSANIVGVKIQKHGEAKSCVTYLFSIYPMRDEKECFTSKEQLIKYLQK